MSYTEAIRILQNAKTKFEKGDSKGFLDNVIEGGLDYFKKSQEKTSAILTQF